ncbi:MAG: nucleotidyl transferase AbiEii/AbiGii toxin family protein [Candidatus Moranbacteria bacterium]|nr:nucleotidyl transferase AbiEii/AbiGii toxin family protein [Candidatus Moranbacteria bacterium]
MISLKEIEKFYPPVLRRFPGNLLREYLQYKILQIIFDSNYANKLCFLGGTALRIVHDNRRFSEDIDFDNFSLNEDEFKEISELVRKRLELEGYEVEIRNVNKGAFRCYLKLPRLLFDNNLSGHKEEKILIQLDTASHGFDYTPEIKLINKFDVFSQIRVTPQDIILSQKIYTIFNRKRMKGRDFYDVVFLFSKTQPNYDYLKEKMNIKNGKELKNKLKTETEGVDFSGLAKDVEPFLFDPADSKRVKLFREFVEELKI